MECPTRRSDALANATNSGAFGSPPVANAHAALARSCALNCHTRRSDALANATNIGAFDSPAVANAHAVLARFYV